MTVFVNSCYKCPMCNNDNEYGLSCNCPLTEVKDRDMPKGGQHFIPYSCPLKKAAVWIELKEDRIESLPNKSYA